jgi:cytochrome P450
VAVTVEPMRLPLRDPEFWQDPYPVLVEARHRHRTARTHSGEVVLLSAADVEAASSHPALVPLGLDALDRLGMTDGPFRRWRALSLNAQQGHDHNRLRSLVGRAFSPRQVDRVRTMLRGHIDGLLDGMEGRVVDVHAELGHEVPLFSICAFLGIPVGDRERIDAFMVGTEEGFSYPMTAEKQARADVGIAALYEYSAELIDRRRTSSGDDLVSALVTAEDEGDRLTHDELLAMIVNLIGGAVGSSDAAIANMVHLMATEPAEIDHVRRDPALVPAFVEEVLRFRPPFRSTRRKALSPVEIGDERLQAGATVLLSRQAANRDPERFTDPDRFRISRPQERHLSFGYGPHYCLGQALARLNLTETAAALVTRWSAVELVDERLRRVPFDPTERFESLRVRPVASTDQIPPR